MVRTQEDVDHITELAMSILKHGLLNPITVTPLEDGKYQLQAGFHRLQAVERLGKTEISAHIREENTGSTKTIAFVENLIRRDMSLQEEAAAVEMLSTKDGLSIGSICDLLGKSTGWVQKRLMVPNLPEEVRNELFDGTISVGHAEILAKMQDPSSRSIVLNCIIQQRLTVRQTEDLANLYNNSPSVGFAVEEGIKKAEEIRNTERVPTRSCDLCHGKADLIKMTLLCACPDCIAWVQEKIQEEIKRRETNGN